jgi:hypothetical protein
MRDCFLTIYVAFSPHKSAVRTKPPSGRGLWLDLSVDVVPIACFPSSVSLV